MSEERAPRIDVQRLTRRFDEVVALDDLSASLKGPGVIGIIGPNGSGKSTLLGILSGLIVPSHGEVRVNGTPIAKFAPHIVAALGVARTFQIVRLAPHLRVWENIAVGLRPSPLWPTRQDPRSHSVRDSLLPLSTELGLTPVLNEWIDEITPADQRKVELARALIGGPSILLLDEPTAGLSDTDAAALIPAIRKAASSALVILVEHNLQLIFSLARTVVVLLEGQLAAEGDPQSVVRLPAVQRAYLGVDDQIAPKADRGGYCPAREHVVECGRTDTQESGSYDDDR
jgi:ABC-type branched-subunit amino acid transport system ATPase component